LELCALGAASAGGAGGWAITGGCGAGAGGGGGDPAPEPFDATLAGALAFATAGFFFGAGTNSSLAGYCPERWLRPGVACGARP
jgi:hypothetical protein